MNLPSKNVSYSESVLSKFPVVLRSLKNKGLTATELYNVVADKVSDIAEFVNILDCLYALGKINIKNGKVVLYFVDKT